MWILMNGKKEVSRHADYASAERVWEQAVRYVRLLPRRKGETSHDYELIWRERKDEV
jgi:hypothetical protein